MRHLRACKFNSATWYFTLSPPLINYQSSVPCQSNHRTDDFVHCPTFPNTDLPPWLLVYKRTNSECLSHFICPFTGKRPFRNQLLLKKDCPVYTPPQPSVSLEFGKMIDFKSVYTSLLSCDLLARVGNLMFCWLTSQLVTSGNTPKWSDV